MDLERDDNAALMTASSGRPGADSATALACDGSNGIDGGATGANL